MLDIRDVFSNLLGLFLLIGVGYGAVRLNLVPGSATKIFSSLLMKITLPATILVSLVQPYDPAFLHDGVLIVVLGTVLLALYGLISWGTARLFRVSGSKKGVWVFACMFSNNGFMGFPIALALFHQEGLALAVFLGIPFNVMAYTLGAKLMCSSRVTQNDEPAPSLASILCTPVNGATLLGLALYLAQLSIPTVLSTPLTHLSNITTPLSMIVTGMTLAAGKASDLLRDKDVFSSCFMRLLVLPLLTWGILVLLPISNPLVVGVTLIIMAMPSPAITAILAQTYSADTAFAARAVFLSSLLCLVSIPLISLLL